MEYYSNRTIANKCSERAFFISPFTTLLLIFINTFALLCSDFVLYCYLLGISTVVLLIMKKESFLRLSLIFIGIFAFTYYVGKNFDPSGLLGSILTMMLMALKLYPIWILASVMTSYSSSALINTLRRMKLPNNLAIAVSIFFRFIPEYMNFLKEINEGAKVRGLRPSLKRPVKTLETYLVPLIFKAFQTGDTMAASLITKGIEYRCEKTSYRNVSLKTIDFVILALEFVGIAVMLWIR